MGRTKNLAGQKMLPNTRPPAQVCRHILVVCVRCGCRIRMSQIWIDRGCPTCRCGTQMGPISGRSLAEFNRGLRNQPCGRGRDAGS